RQRARAREIDIGFSPRLLREMPRRTWPEVSAEVEHVVDFEAHINQFQVTPRAAVMTMEIPLAYAQDIVAIQQQGAMTVFFRSYLPPPAPIFQFEAESWDLVPGSHNDAED